jgi:iron complex outermembrane recepter protein
MKVLYRSSCVLAAFVVATGLSSGTTSTAVAQEQRRVLLDEVVVTAQRREERAQDVAISMTMFDQDQLANANMVNTADLAIHTPSMSLNQRFGPENASFAIRGFTKELRTTASVGVYFAEVVAPRGQNVQDSGDGAGPGTMFDLQNIQVLKGPQGTLFGRNTTGGAVLITPHRPTDEFEGFVEVSYGNFRMRKQQAVVNIPLHDRVRLRLGIENMERDGHLNNYTRMGASKLGNANYTAGRLSLEVDFTDQLQNYTVINYGDSDTHGYAPSLFVCNTRDDPSENPILLLTQQACQDQLARERAAGNDGFYDIASTVPNPTVQIEDLRIVNHLTWYLADNLTLKGILGYASLTQENAMDVFGTQFTETQAALIDLPVPVPGGLADPNREFSAGVTQINPNHPVTSQDTWVAELQVQGFSFGDRLEWQAGVYYENSRPDGSSGNHSPILINCELATAEQRDLSQVNCNDPLGGVLGGVLAHDIRTEYKNQAVYGQASYDFLDRFKFTAGLRYTKDEAEARNNRTIQRFVFTQPQEPTVILSESAVKSSAPTGLLELQYRPLEDVMLYAKYVRGYRQGSVNPAADAGVDSHDEETVDNYEIGAKTEFYWPVPGRFNIALFYNDLTDMQLQTGYVSPTAGPTTAIFNAGKARIRGLEFDGFLRLFDRLTASFGFSYLDTELVEQDQEGNQQRVEDAGGPLAGFTFTPIAVEGDELPFAPEISYNVSLNYTLPLPPSIGMVSVGATYAHTGKQRATSSVDSPFSELPAFSILNLNAKWADIFGTPLDFSMFATNVLDEEYLLDLTGTFSALGFDSRMVGMPRMYGARLRYTF